MAEELRFFLRTALYSAVISAIYWFASYDAVRDRYDWAGTAMLVATALAAAAVVAVLAASVRRARDGTTGGSPLAVVNRVIGLGDPGGAADDAPLSVELDPMPTGSAWPVAAGIAAMLIGLGLVYGPWLWLPGLVLLVAAVWGWVTELAG